MGDGSIRMEGESGGEKLASCRWKTNVFMALENVTSSKV